LIIVEIDLYSDVPSYVQLADQLRVKILDGTYAPRESIPSITSLQQQTGLAVNTIRKGIDILEEEGLVHTVPGRGTFVVEQSQAPGHD
jgi:GntR family transcriptional regulator